MSKFALSRITILLDYHSLGNQGQSVMTLGFLRTTTAISGTLVLAFCSSAFAADMDAAMSRAVSAPNGKIEIYGGDAGVDGFDSSMVFRGGASFSVPVGDMFGIQADVAAANVFDETVYGGTLHAFTRDPNAYLFGVAGGLGASSVANFQYVGPEVELYMNNVSFQAYGGYLNLTNSSVNTGHFFGFADVSLYATPDLMFKVGASSVAGFNSGHVGLEWQLSDTTPVSFTLDGRLGDNGFAAATAGLKLYFGGAEKSLMRRHREDDPPNRSLDIFNAAGSAFSKPVTTGEVPPDYGSCPTGEHDIDPTSGLNCVPDQAG